MATSSQAIETTTDKVLQKREYSTLERVLWSPSYAKDLARFLGSEESAAAFIAEIFNQARKLPELHRCTQLSIAHNVARVAALRLNPALPNMVFFIARRLEQPDKSYAMELTVQYGYAGLRNLVMRCPEVRDCFTREVCVNDVYEQPPSLITPPVHRLPARFQPRGRVEGYYAVVQLTNGHWRTLQMSVKEVEDHAKRYVRQPGPAWNKGTRPDVADGLTPFDKMGLKTCLRMLLNGRDVPMTTEVREALAIDPTLTSTGEGYGETHHTTSLLPSSVGLPLDQLINDISGGHDITDVAARMGQESRRVPVYIVNPTTGEIETNHSQEHEGRQTSTEGSEWREVLERNRSRLVDAQEAHAELVPLLAQIDVVSQDKFYPDTGGLSLAETVLQWLDKLDERTMDC
jgi:phage RecT family recombinase